MAKVKDPTLTLLADLRDPTLWVIHRGVPIFKPHRRKTVKEEGGKQVVKTVVVTRADLPKIAAAARERQRSTGNVMELTLGHCLPGKEVPESRQPRAVGYYLNYRVGTFGPDGEPALLADEYIRREDWEEAKTYPHRSAEYYPPSREITRVARLRRDPELDLGLLTYARDGQAYLYVNEGTMAEDDLDDLDPSMQPGEEGDEEPSHEDQREEYLKHCYSHPYARGMVEHYGLTAPSSTNGALPVPPPPPAGGRDAPPEQMARSVARDDLAVKYARMEREVKQMREERNQADARRRVTQLQAEGYLIPDTAREVGKLAKMKTDQERDERMEEVRTCYQRDPTGGILLDTAGTDTPVSARQGEPERFVGDSKAWQYLKANVGADYADAERYAKGEIDLHGQPRSVAHTNGNGRR